MPVFRGVDEELITRWWPAPVTFAAIGILTTWLGSHFADAYRKRKEAAMVETIPVPPSKESDARNRAARTFWTGLAVDVAVAVVLTVAPSILGSDFTWSTKYWQTLGLLAAKTVITTVVSYFLRKLVPPQFSPDREVPSLPAQTTPARPVTSTLLPDDTWTPKHDGSGS